ncbi:MAG: class I SAM-dependent methyltransferase [Deltaproteobacteria bacterium]|nr:class I SAM-dependent methyltransferase [Deltaproteobacteria bacterium]
MALEARFVRNYYDQRIAAASTYLQRRWLTTPGDCKRYFQTLLALDWALSPARFDTVVEIGCGPGVWTRLIAAHARRVFALDISAGMLAQFANDLTGCGPVERVCADFTSAPLARDTADAIICIRALEYFPDKEAAIGEMARVGRDGASLFIVTKNPDYRRGRNGSEPSSAERARLHSGQIAPVQLTTILRRHGFADLKVRAVTLLRTEMPAVWGLCDVLHSLAWKYPAASTLPGWVRPHVESYVVTGTLQKLPQRA